MRKLYFEFLFYRIVDRHDEFEVVKTWLCTVNTVHDRPFIFAGDFFFSAFVRDVL